MSRKRKHPRHRKGRARHTPSASPQQFFAQPPPDGVSHDQWARAFLEAQSPNLELRRRGRDALTEMGCAFTDGPSPPSG